MPIFVADNQAVVCFYVLILVKYLVGRVGTCLSLGPYFKWVVPPLPFDVFSSQLGR